MKKYLKIFALFSLVLAVSFPLYGCQKKDIESMKAIHEMDENIKNGDSDSKNKSENIKKNKEVSEKENKVSTENSDNIKDKNKENSQTSERTEKENDTKNNNRTVVIDAGHQDHGMPEHEPIGPGSGRTKPKLSSGTQGVVTGVPEYRLTLDLSLMLMDRLQRSGYRVVMVRTTDAVNMSNRERAEIANGCIGNGIDNVVFLRIHANSVQNSSVSGALTMAPGKDNSFVSPEVIDRSGILAKDILYNLIKTTGTVNKGVVYTNEMSGINWSKVPVTIIEVGFMSNPNEDRLMQTAEYRQKIVNGIADGVDEYFR